VWLPWIPWDVAGAAAAGTATAALAGGRIRVRRVRRAVPWLRELALVLALYAGWQGAGSLSLLQAGGAAHRGRQIWDLERALHVPSEAALQRVFLGHTALVRLLDIYYGGAHVPLLVAFLVWVFARHRPAYPRVRNSLALFTGASLLIQFLPVAPPRLLKGVGIVDTGLTVGPSVYGPHGTAGIDQLAAMPSIHVGWALAVGLGVAMVARTRWRYLALLHPAVTVLAVVVTGNHYWADAVVAALLVVLAQVAAAHLPRLSRRPAAGRSPLLQAGGAAPRGTRRGAPGVGVAAVYDLPAGRVHEENHPHIGVTDAGQGDHVRDVDAVQRITDEEKVGVVDDHTRHGGNPAG
jgi:hypothetical protein